MSRRDRSPKRGAGSPAAPPWWPAAVVLAVSLAVYLPTCARTVTLVDSGELIVACASLGVAHPPGFPFYTLVGHLFSLLPAGSVAFRLAAMSAVFAALTAALVTLVVSEVVAWARREDGAVGRDARVVSAGASIGAGLSLAFSATLWAYATVAEVYSLTLTLLTAAVWLLLRWRRAGAAGPLPWLVGLALGLGIGVHHVTVILAVPGLLAFVVATGGWRAVAPRRLLAAGAGLAAGLLSYLYLPLAAARRPVLNWGDPSSLERLWWHVSARQYRISLFSGSLDEVWRELVELVRLAPFELGPLGMVAAAAGLVWLWRRDRAMLWCVAVVAMVGVSYAVNYDIAEDTEAYVLTTYLVAAVALGGGLTCLLSACLGRRGLAVVAVAAALVTPAAAAALHWRSSDRSRDLVARSFVEDAVAGIAPGGVLLTLEWQLYAPWLYLHHIEGLRPDLAVVDVNLCRRSWYVGQYLPADSPGLMAEVQQPAELYRRELENWEHARPHDPARLTRLFVAMLNAMLATPLPDSEAHSTLPMEPGVGGELAWAPHGLSMKLTTTTPVRVEPAPRLHLEPLLGDPASLTQVARTKVRPYYALMLANRGRYLAMAGELDGARAAVDQALALEPASAPLHLLRGELELASGQPDAARQAFAKALQLDADNREAAERLRQLELAEQPSLPPALEPR